MKYFVCVSLYLFAPYVWSHMYLYVGLITDAVMMLSSNGTFFALLALGAGNSPVIDEFPSKRPVTWSFDVFFDLCLNKRLSKQSWGCWFERPSRSLWRHCNDTNYRKGWAISSACGRKGSGEIHHHSGGWHIALAIWFYSIFQNLNFIFIFLNDSCCVNLIYWRGILCLYSCLYTLPNFIHYFSTQMI